MSALLSACGLYRYYLRRRWLGGTGTVVWIMLNPSTADADVDDPTIRRVVGFSQRWGFAAAEVVNLYAYRATEPRTLRTAAKAGIDVIGPDNDRHLAKAANNADRVVVAWGAHEPARSKRTLHATSTLTVPIVWCLGWTKGGQPRHPLMLPYATRLEPWELFGSRAT